MTAARHGGASHSRTCYRPTRALLVDDNPVALVSTSGLLHHLGVQVTAVSSGREALSLVDASPIGVPWDMAFLDLRMPHIDGAMLAQALRHRSQWVHVPIVGMAASVSGAEHARCLAAGMSDSLPKPVALSELAATVVYWSQGRRVALAARGALHADAPNFAHALRQAEGCAVDCVQRLKDFSQASVLLPAGIAALVQHSQRAVAHTTAARLRKALIAMGMGDQLVSLLQLEHCLLNPHPSAKPLLDAALKGLELELQRLCLSVERFFEGG